MIPRSLIPCHYRRRHCAHSTRIESHSRRDPRAFYHQSSPGILWLLLLVFLYWHVRHVVKVVAAAVSVRTPPPPPRLFDLFGARRWSTTRIVGFLCCFFFTTKGAAMWFGRVGRWGWRGKRFSRPRDPPSPIAPVLMMTMMALAYPILPSLHTHARTYIYILALFPDWKCPCHVPFVWHQ